MCIFHKWSKWEQYEQKGTIVLGRLAPKNVQGKSFNCVDLRQRRRCVKCNKVQDRLIQEGVSL